MNAHTQQFIRDHANDDIRQLALKGASQPDVDLPFALDQIRGRQVAARKLPSWAAVDGILYPPHLSMEQCSSQQTAVYKAQQLLRVCHSVNTFVDLTGGLGVDFSFLSRAFQKRIYVEQQPELCRLATHNFPQLSLDAEIVNTDGTYYLRTMHPADAVFIDPARRDSHGERTYGIADCTPNILDHLPLLMQKAAVVMLKLSPMLDWHKAVDDINACAAAPIVREVHIVSVGNECKELLLILHATPSQTASIQVHCADITPTATTLFSYTEPHDTAPTPPPLPAIIPGNSYLHVPNASLMKAGCFSLLAARYHMSPLSANTHLFVAHHAADGFPGRIFRIEAVTTLNKKELKTHLAHLTHANISVRNFPLSADALRRKLKLKDGGDTYLYATTLANRDRVILICRKEI